MAGHLLTFKHPPILQASLAARPIRPRDSTRFNRVTRLSAAIPSDAKLDLVRSQSFGPSVSPLPGIVGFGRQGLSLGLQVGRAAAAGGDGEAEEEGQDVEDSTFPAAFRELTIDRGDPPNYYLLAAGFCTIVLMRDAILQEIANWSIWSSRLVLYAAEAITMGAAMLTNVLAEPIAFLLTFVGWAVMAVSDVYSIIVEATPVRALSNALLLSLAVLSIGDASASKTKGSRLVGIATAIGLAGFLEFISPETIILMLASITAYASFIQKADLVTVFMPATVTIVAISEPILQVTMFVFFLLVSVYANWKATPQPQEANIAEQQQEAKSIKGKPSWVITAITFAICVSLATRWLYSRLVVWLSLR